LAAVFVPYELIMQHLMMIVAAHMAFMLISVAGQMGRAAGAAMFFFLCVNSGAYDLRVYNGSGQDYFIGDYGENVQYFLKQGTALDLPGWWLQELTAYRTNELDTPFQSVTLTTYSGNTNDSVYVVLGSGDPAIQVSPDEEESQWESFTQGLYLGLGVFAFRLTMMVLRQARATVEREVA